MPRKDADHFRHLRSISANLSKTSADYKTYKKAMRLAMRAHSVAESLTIRAAMLSEEQFSAFKSGEGFWDADYGFHERARA